MAIPSAKYAVDYTDSLGLKWSKQISQMYTSLGDVDLSAAISSLNDDLVKTVYRKSRTFNPIYDNAITYASVGHDSLVMKYFARNGYPTDNITSGTVIVNHSSPDGISYVTGVNEDASVPYNGGLSDSRVLVDTEYNKMLFKVTLREMTLNTSDVPIGGANYNDPTYTDVELKDIDDNKWYGLFYHNGAKVWNGSSWVDTNIAPVLICSGDSVQSFQGGGSAFNNLFNNYNGTMGSGQNIEFTNAASNYYWTAHNFVNRMNIENYSMGWSDNYDYKPSFADDFDSMKAFMLNYLTENSYSPWQSVWFQLCREVHQISNDMSILLTVMCYACLDGNNNLWINWDNIYTFPIIKGSSVSKFLAGHGLYYLTDSSADLTGITPDTLHNSSAIWVGEMSANGTTTGRWIKGADIENYTGYNKDGNINNPNFDPSGGGSDVDGDDMDSMHTGFASSLNGCAKYYLMSPSDIRDLITDFYTHAFAGSTMSESIISCYLCGIEPSYFLAVSQEKIKIPTLSQKAIFESVDKYDEITAVNNILPVGHISVPRLNKDFHDFSPYSIYEIFVPYCGWCSLPDTVAGRTIWVEYHVDIRTMSGKGIVLVEGSDGGKATCAEMAMNFGVTSPFAVIEAGLARQAAVTAGIQTAVGFASGVVGATSGHNALTVSGVGNAIQGCANGAMSSMTNYTQVQGKAGDTSDFANGRQCYLKISWSKTDEVVKNSMFGHTIGYLCNEVGKLSEYHGFTVCLNPHITGIDCTEEEKEEIKNLLENGVIL